MTSAHRPGLLWPFVVPWFVVLALIFLEPLQDAQDQTSSAARTPPFEPVAGQTLLVVVDSLREQALRDHMPHTLALADKAPGQKRPVHTCSANFTLPCIQTMLEGRQSPFAAGLHNFTGTKGGALNLPQMATAEGIDTVLFSDFTLHDLYGRGVRRSVNVETLPISTEARDFHALKEAKKELQAGTRFVVLHLVGTDKVAHKHRPGHPKYAEHFRAVDAALAPLYAMLDPHTDHLIVTGDHGHDARGHHTTDSVALLRSPLTHPLLAPHPGPLDQTEMTYLIATTLGLGLSGAYEGRYLGLEDLPAGHAPAPALAPLATRYAAALGQRPSEPLSETIARLRAAKRLEPRGDFYDTSPLLVLLLGWLMGALLTLRGQQVRFVPATLLGALLGALLWAAPWAGVPSPALGVAALAGLGALAFWVSRWHDRQAARFACWIALVVSLAAFTGFVAPAWRQFFHSHGQFQPQTPALFIAMLGLGLLGSWALSNSPTARLPMTLGVPFLFALPSGVYFYQFGQNIMRGVLIGCAVWVLVALARQRTTLKVALGNLRAKVGATVAFLTSLLLLWQTSGGWEWHFNLTHVVHTLPDPLVWLLWAGLGVLLVCMVPRHKLAIGLLWIACGAYGHGIALLSDGTLIGAMVPPLWLCGVLSLKGTDSEKVPEQVGLFLVALGLMSLWIMMRGFFLQNVGFDFALEYAAGFDRERDVAIVATLMTFFKYALPVWLLVWVWGAFAKGWQVGQWALWWIGLKILTLLLQIHCGPVFFDEKLYELAMAEVTCVFNLGVMVWTGMLGLKVGQWVGRKRADSRMSDHI